MPASNSASSARAVARSSASSASSRTVTVSAISSRAISPLVRACSHVVVAAAPADETASSHACQPCWSAVSRRGLVVRLSGVLPGAGCISASCSFGIAAQQSVETLQAGVCPQELYEVATSGRHVGGQMTELGDAFLVRARESLAGAESEVANGPYNNAANRGYYACF